MNLAGQNLTNANFHYATLTNANFSQANLTNANFDCATLTGANFTGAEVRGANFARRYRGTGITAAQLYSTASYQAHDLTGIGLTRQQPCRREPRRPEPHECRSFITPTLTNANFSQANLTNADFSGYSYPVYDE